MKGERIWRGLKGSWKWVRYRDVESPLFFSPSEKSGEKILGTAPWSH